MDAKLVDKLRKVLALTASPNEHEATLAAETLQRLLTEHNLSMADLEGRGAAHAAKVMEHEHDLGKAAFKWKLDLATTIAEHYFCIGLVTTDKKVRFVGRPDNVESLTMLYEWLIRQIANVSRAERETHRILTGEHVDPLRWQVNFGLGVVQRLGTRLYEIREWRERGGASQAEANTTALVVRLVDEANDYMEEKYGRRLDGKPTKREREWTEKWHKANTARNAFKATCEAAGDMEPYYAAYPHERPEQLTTAQQAKRDRDARKANEKWERKWEREQERARERERNKSPEEKRKDAQANKAKRAGRESADKINLQPFLTGEKPKKGDLR